jgi:hypothetical protein
MGDILNDVRWELMQNDYNTAAVHEISSQTWATSSKIDATIDSAAIILKFIDTEFSAGQTWYLVYSEWNGDNCTARRFIRIDVVDNTFYLSLADDDTICNSFSGATWSNENLATPRDMSVDFEVTMHKDEDFRLRQWIFDGQITVAGTGFAVNPTFSVTSGTTTHGSWLISNIFANTFTFTFTVTNPTTDDYDEDTVIFSADLNGPIVNLVDCKLTITNGRAISGATFPATTDDNLLLPLGGDREQNIRLEGVPNTPVIAIVP